MALELFWSADFEGQMAADEHADAFVGQEAIDGCANRFADFEIILGLGIGGAMQLVKIGTMGMSISGRTNIIGTMIE